MGLLGPSGDELWQEFLMSLGGAGVNLALTDDEGRTLAILRGEKVFDFFSNIDEQSWNEFDELYRKWLKRTGRSEEGE